MISYAVYDFNKNSFIIFRLHYDFGNLFNGDKALGDNTNLFLNQNWEDIFNELKKAIENAFGSVYRDYTKQILESLPFNEIFLVD